MEGKVEVELPLLWVPGEHAGHHKVGLVDRDEAQDLLVSHRGL